MKIGISSAQVTDRLNPLATMTEVVDEAIARQIEGECIKGVLIPVITVSSQAAVREVLFE